MTPPVCEIGFKVNVKLFLCISTTPCRLMGEWRYSSKHS